jgi:hypothetical protein
MFLHPGGDYDTVVEAFCNFCRIVGGGGNVVVGACAHLAPLI